MPTIKSIRRNYKNWAGFVLFAANIAFSKLGIKNCSTIGLYYRASICCDFT